VKMHEKVTGRMGTIIAHHEAPVLITFSPEGHNRAIAEEDGRNPGFVGHRTTEAQSSLYMGRPWRIINEQIEEVRVWSDQEQLPEPPKPDPRELLNDIVASAQYGISEHHPSYSEFKGVPGHPIRGAARLIQVDGRRFVLRLDEVS
jgi:hypothetical protein